ncbi:Uncharacterised protein [Mycobacteroides abscessus subsp. abscessus]|nr:Uncharacterised protein [Mycobacteroides abscessus subsp. abscessus]
MLGSSARFDADRAPLVSTFDVPSGATSLTVTAQMASCAVVATLSRRFIEPLIGVCWVTGALVNESAPRSWNRASALKGLPRAIVAPAVTCVMSRETRPRTSGRT